MKIFLLSITLLLFEINAVFGYSISKAKNEQLTDIAQTESDIYEINEGSKKTWFVYPKPAKPTLREIVYYHVIETPYEDEKKIGEESEGPDFDDTRRPFTNSHGLQFLPESTEERHEVEISSNSESDIEETNNDGGSNETAPTIEELLRETPEELSGEQLESSQSSIEPSEESGSSEPLLETYEDISKEEEQTSSTPTISSTTTTSTPPTTSSPPTTESKTGAVNDKKISARNRLFGQVRRKYEDTKRHVKNSRRKRDSNNMPEAPSLTPLNYGLLPDNIRRLISTTEKPSHLYLDDKPKPFTEDSFKEQLQHKIEEMLSEITPDSNSDEKGDDEDDELEKYTENDSSSGEQNKRRAPRTYGMNLRMGQGYVWNDLLGDPGMSFDVGLEDTETAENIDEDETEMESEEVIANIEIRHPTESRPINLEDKKHNNKEISINDEKKNDKENKKDFEDIPVGQPMFQVTEDYSKKIKEEPLLHIKEDTKQVKTVTPHEDIDTESLTEETKVKIKEEKELEELKDSREKTGGTEDENVRLKDKDGAFDGKERKAVPKPDLIQELMKDEQFWRWLNEWTATYMELLMKHIKRLVHGEVARQVKKVTLELKKEIQLDDKKQSDSTDVTNKEDIKDKNPSKLPLKDTKNDEKSSKPTEDTKNKDKEANINIEDKTHKDNSDVKINTNMEPQIKDGNLIIDGKEIKLTHTTNFVDKDEKDDLLKHRQDKDKNKKPTTPSNVDVGNNKETPVTITAENIYGSSVGSDKVTNIFIFYPTDEGDDEEENNGVFDEGNPSTNNNTNVFNIGTDVFDIDNRIKPELTEHKDQSIMTDTESTTPKTENLDVTEKESKKEEKSNEETKKPQDKTEIEEENETPNKDKEITTQKPLDSNTNNVIASENPDPDKKGLNQSLEDGKAIVNVNTSELKVKDEKPDDTTEATTIKIDTVDDKNKESVKRKKTKDMNVKSNKNNTSSTEESSHKPDERSKDSSTNKIEEQDTDSDADKIKDEVKTEKEIVKDSEDKSLR